MSFKEEMLASDGLYGYFFKFIVEEFRKIVKDENPDLWKYIIDNHIGLRIMERYTAEMIYDDIRMHKGHLRKDQMQTMLMNWRNKEECSSFQIRAHWKMINDKMRISGFVLEVSAPNLCIEICKRIYDLDNLKEDMIWSLHHEAGHMIDYIRNREVISFKEWQEQEESITREYEKYYEETREPIASAEQRDEYNIRYYQIPIEQSANDAIGISVKDMIDLDRRNDEKYRGKLVTITIDQVGIRDIPPKDIKSES